jgi:hypothetical protein
MIQPVQQYINRMLQRGRASAWQFSPATKRLA